MGFPRQEYWSRLPFSSPGDLSDPGIEPTSPALAGGLLLSHQGSPSDKIGKNKSCGDYRGKYKVLQVSFIDSDTYMIFIVSYV